MSKKEFKIHKRVMHGGKAGYNLVERVRRREDKAPGSRTGEDTVDDQANRVRSPRDGQEPVEQRISHHNDLLLQERVTQMTNFHLVTDDQKPNLNPRNNVVADLAAPLKIDLDDAVDSRKGLDESGPNTVEDKKLVLSSTAVSKSNLDQLKNKNSVAAVATTAAANRATAASAASASASATADKQSAKEAIMTKLRANSWQQTLLIQMLSKMDAADVTSGGCRAEDDERVGDAEMSGHSDPALKTEDAIAIGNKCGSSIGESSIGESSGSNYSSFINNCMERNNAEDDNREGKG